jgi:hypothetical protein
MLQKRLLADNGTDDCGVLATSHVAQWMPHRPLKFVGCIQVLTTAAFSAKPFASVSGGADHEGGRFSVTPSANNRIKRLKQI